MVKDSYKTINSKSEGLFKDKGSKFYSFAYPVESEDEVKLIIKDIKKQYHDARHHCYAYKIGIGEQNFRMNDDGEPSGTAGKPIYGQIQSHGLSDILIVVVRYFGGVLLGTSGLINAYKNAATESVNKAQIIEKVVKHSIGITFSYELLSHVMRMIKEENLEIDRQELTDKCLMYLKVRLSEVERINGKLAGIYGIAIIH